MSFPNPIGQLLIQYLQAASASQAYVQQPWSDAEMEILNDAAEAHAHDWTLISREHFCGRRSPQELLVKFVEIACHQKLQRQWAAEQTGAIYRDPAMRSYQPHPSSEN